MTRLENQLRQDLLDIAQQVTADDLRPLRRPPAVHRRTASRPHLPRWADRPVGLGRRWSGAARWLIPLTAGVAVACVAVGLWLAGNSVSEGDGPVAPRFSVSDPPVFPIFVGRVVHYKDTVELKLMSPVTGQVVRSIAGDVGFDGYQSESPDGKFIYLDDPLGEIYQVSVATGKFTAVAGGLSPVVSPDGRYLAYLKEPTWLAIRDLRTGVTRTIDLARLMGAKSMLIFGEDVAWLGNGKQVVVVPEPGQFTRLPGLKANRCGQQDAPNGLCMIVVNTNASQLTASRVYAPGVRPVRVQSGNSIEVGIGDISGDWASRTTLLISTKPMLTPITHVYAVTIDGDRGIKRWTIALPRNVVSDTPAPYGDRILYLLNTHEYQLWVATIRNGRIVSPRRLLAGTKTVIPGSPGW